MAFEAITLEQANLAYDPHWLNAADADALFSQLNADMPWTVHRIRLFGREVDSPRLSCWMGDPDAVYTYSSTRFAPQPWLPALGQIRERLGSELDTPFNSVLANLYRDGSDAMGWHSDDEPELGDAPVIASVSLGETRRFSFKHKKNPALKSTFELTHGSLLVMAGDTQKFYRHALPRTRKAIGPRINLTFRWIKFPDKGTKR